MCDKESSIQIINLFSERAIAFGKPAGEPGTIADAVSDRDAAEITPDNKQPRYPVGQSLHGF